VDKVFIGDLDRDPTSRLIVSTVVDSRTAWGCPSSPKLETAAQYDQIVALGCDFAQGFYFSRPRRSPSWMRWLPTLMPASTTLAGGTLAPAAEAGCRGLVVV